MLNKWSRQQKKNKLIRNLIKVYWIIFAFLYFSSIPLIAKVIFMFILITSSSLQWGIKGGLAATVWFVVVRLGYHFLVPIKLTGLIGGLLSAILISYLVGSLGALFQEQNKKLIKANQKLKSQLKKGKKIHKQLLSSEVTEFDDVKIASCYQPAEEIGADYYQVIELEDKLVFYLSDVVGHGLGGSLLNIFLRGTVKNFIFNYYQQGEELSPKEIIKFVDYKYSEESFPEDYFISLILFVMDKDTKRVKYVNAGFHTPPLLIKNGELISLEAAGLPITTAVNLNEYKFIEQEFIMDKESTLLLTTDGLLEAETGGTMYGAARLKKLVNDNYYLPPDLLLNSIIEDLEKFTTGKQLEDDVSLLALTNRRVVDKLSLIIPSRYERIEEIKEKTGRLIAPYWDRIDYLLIGLQEIVINAIEHGNRENQALKVKVEAFVLADSIIIEVEDGGTGFNWQEKINEKIDLTDFSEDGRGLVIASKAFDKLGYNQAGNKAILYKRID